MQTFWNEIYTAYVCLFCVKMIPVEMFNVSHSGCNTNKNSKEAKRSGAGVDEIAIEIWIFFSSSKAEIMKLWTRSISGRRQQTAGRKLEP